MLMDANVDAGLLGFATAILEYARGPATGWSRNNQPFQNQSVNNEERLS